MNGIPIDWRAVFMFHKQCENRQGMHSQTLRGNTIMFVISLTTILSDIVTNTALHGPKYAFCPKLADFMAAGSWESFANTF